MILVVSSEAASATPAATPAPLRIYDPAGESTVVVTISDVVQSSVRAKRVPGGTGILSFGLTRRGGARFHRLTLALARRGARLHRPQRMAVAIDGSVSRPLIDHRFSPDGLDGRAPLVVDVPRFSMAQRFARVLRRG